MRRLSLASTSFAGTTLDGVSGTTQVAVLVAAIGVLGVVIAALISASTQRRNARRTAHATAVGPARLVKRELEQAYATAEDALGRGEESTELESAEWDVHKAVLASQLSQEELLVLERCYAGVKLGAVPLVLATNPLALQAISWLAEGTTNVTRPRRTERSRAPANMDLRCECGHVFGHHVWRSVRRPVRVRHRDAEYRDVGFECTRCSCPRFKGVASLNYM